MAPALTLPSGFQQVFPRIEAKGFPAYLVGRGVAELLRGQTPCELAVWTTAPLQTLRHLFPFAVTTVGSRGLVLPTPAGPVDLHGIASAASLETALAARDFRLHAIAYRPADARFVDPWNGLEDLDAGRIRAVGDAGAMLSRDPLRALRAVRLASAGDLSLDPRLRNALPGAAPALKAMRGPRVRRELDALLLGPRAGTALRNLREFGFEAALVTGARDDAADVVERLPPDLTLRWAAWLRDTGAVILLRNLRTPRDRAARIERWLHRHPVDAGDAGALASRARKLLRSDARDREPLLALRRAEIQPGDAPAQAQFQRLLDALDRQRDSDRAAAIRHRLAIDGQQVMDHLGCRPGAQVGEALRHLAERVAQDPALNQPETLLALLDAWWAER